MSQIPKNPFRYSVPSRYDFIPTTMDLKVVDFWIETKDIDSFTTARSLIRDEGLLCGGSSGANMFAALEIAKLLASVKRVVVILPDGIRNYMTKFVSDHWMEARNFLEPPKPLARNEWWWSLPVSRLELAKPVVVSSVTTCGQVLEVLRKGLQHVPVIEDGKLKAFVEKKRLMGGLVSGEVSSGDMTDKVWDKTFRRVDLETTLGRVSRILEMDNYVAVEGEKGNFLGVLTSDDVYGFVFQKDKVNGV